MLTYWYSYSLDRYASPFDNDKIIFVEILDERSDLELFKCVLSLMIHGPCGHQNRKSPCMQNGRCTKYIPKKIVERATVDANGYPLYIRRDNGVIIKNGHHLIDNRFVVPYQC